MFVKSQRYKFQYNQMTSQIKYLSDVQLSPKAFNEQQKIKIQDFLKTHSQKELNSILYGNIHHDLKAHRSSDYSLNDKNLEKLHNSGICFKNIDSDHTFAQSYKQLYNNDMPVFITSDSMLHAIHKFYDTFLEQLENTVMIQQFINICGNMLKALHNIKPTDQNIEILKKLEVYFTVPYVILQTTDKLKKIPTSVSILPTIIDKDEILKIVDYQYSQKNVEYELQNYKQQIFENYENIIVKAQKFIKLYDLDMHPYNLFHIANYSPKYGTVFAEFEPPTIDFPVEFKFGGDQMYEDIIISIIQNDNIELECNGVKIKMDGSQFKPRGHYTNNVMLYNYFIANTWLSKFVICFDQKNELSSNMIVLASIIAKIGETCINQVDEYQSFVTKIIGESDNYNIKEFLDLINNIIPKTNTLSDSIDWIINNAKMINDYCFDNMKKINQLSKFNDDINNVTLFFI